jgi:hypothetical protein
VEKGGQRGRVDRPASMDSNGRVVGVKPVATPVQIVIWLAKPNSSAYPTKPARTGRASGLAPL